MMDLATTENILLVFLGGGIGSVGRFWVSTHVQQSFDGVFPLGTMTVNLIGCFLVGILWSLSGKFSLPFPISAFFFAGLLGGFTTFSSFGLETFAMIHEGAWGMATLFALSTNVFGFLLAAGGFHLTELMIK